MSAITKDIRLMLAGSFLIGLFLIGLFADQIAQSGGIIPFGPSDVSRSISIYSDPGTTEVGADGSTLTHYFGTDQYGRDVASRLVHGIMVAFKVGVWSTLISLMIALLLGGVAGYKGDYRDRINLLQIACMVVGIVLLHYYIQELSYTLGGDGEFRFSILKYGLGMLIGLPLLYLIYRLIGRWPIKSIWLRWDSIVLKMIEVFNSIPRLFLLLAIFALITTPSLWSVILIIGFIRWPSLARLIRAEIINIRQDDYIKSARILGLSSFKIVLYHVIPNIYKPIMIFTALSIGSAILIESTLSFLHIGLPIDQVSWGRMLGDSREYISAWWLAVGPGLLIFSLILAFNVLADRFSHHFKKEKGI